MTDQEAGIWLRLNSTLKEAFSSWVAFTANEIDNLKTLVSYIHRMKRDAESTGAAAERKKLRDANYRKKLRNQRFGCMLDQYDHEVRVRERKLGYHR